MLISLPNERIRSIHEMVISAESEVGQVATEVDNVVVSTSNEHGHHFNMSAMGSRVWQLTLEPRTVSALCDVLQQEFEVDRATGERDVLAFLEKLHARGLLRVSPD